METKTVKLVCFSPTGTTKRIIEAIADGIDHANTELINFTLTSDREIKLKTSNSDLLVVASPVYMGRIPSLVKEFLLSIKASNTPTVCVVVYGNRTYGKALLELNDILKQCECIPIAGAAYIGEHSFSSTEYPCAKGRPDINDLEEAKHFGNKIKDKISNLESIDNCPSLKVSGSFPYGGITELWKVDFIGVNENCKQCGTCAKFCPLGAVDFNNSKVIDTEKCIICCACIKNCPEQARFIKPSMVKDAAIRISNNLKERKEPEFFI